MKTDQFKIILVSTCLLAAHFINAQIPQQIDPSEDEVRHISEEPSLIWVLIGVVGVLVLWYVITKLIKQRKAE